MSHSSLGRLVETLMQDDVLDEIGHDEEQAERSRKAIITLLTGIPHYVVDDRVLQLVWDDYKTGTLKRSMKAMVRAGIKALPFDPILVEFDKLPRSFVRLQSKPFWPQPPGIDEIHADIYAYPVLAKADSRPHNVGGMMIAAVDKVGVPIQWVDDPDQEEPFIATAVGGTRDAPGIDGDISIAAVLAMSLAMLMLNTRGIALEHVSMDKLNKARAKSGKGKTPLSDYHVVRVGTIYDRQGNAHSVAGSGRHMPVHWRAGHVRNQRYGPRDAEGTHKQIWIQPCLVNYAGDGPVPVPKKEIRL